MINTIISTYLVPPGVGVIDNSYNLKKKSSQNHEDYSLDIWHELCQMDLHQGCSNNCTIVSDERQFRVIMAHLFICIDIICTLCHINKHVFTQTH